MKIAYGKLGRSIPLTLKNASNVGGDIEVVRLFDILRQDHEVHLVTRNREDAHYSNVINHWKESSSSLFDTWSVDASTFGDAKDMGRNMERYPDDPRWLEYSQYIRSQAHKLPKFDAWFIWIGQHGTTLSFLPRIKQQPSDDPRLKGVTRPLATDLNYCFPVVAILNELNIQPHWLCPDPRNRIKFRDLENPNQRPILAQYDQEKNSTFYSPKHGIQPKKLQYTYSGIELLAVSPPKESTFTHRAQRKLFGLLVNEGYSNLGVKKNRVDLVKKWLNPLPIEYEMYGHWCEASQATLGRRIDPIALSEVDRTLQKWLTTMTFPASGTGWATAKPWECFKAGTLCFKHPEYDDQRHIYGSHMPLELREFLCPSSPLALARRLKDIDENKDGTLWLKYAELQWAYLLESYTRLEDGAKSIKDILRKCISS